MRDPINSPHFCTISRSSALFFVFIDTCPRPTLGFQHPAQKTRLAPCFQQFTTTTPLLHVTAAAPSSAQREMPACGSACRGCPLSHVRDLARRSRGLAPAPRPSRPSSSRCPALPCCSASPDLLHCPHCCPPLPVPTSMQRHISGETGVATLRNKTRGQNGKVSAQGAGGQRLGHEKRTETRRANRETASGDGGRRRRR